MLRSVAIVFAKIEKEMRGAAGFRNSFGFKAGFRMARMYDHGSAILSPALLAGEESGASAI